MVTREWRRHLEERERTGTGWGEAGEEVKRGERGRKKREKEKKRRRLCKNGLAIDSKNEQAFQSREGGRAPLFLCWSATLFPGRFGCADGVCQSHSAATRLATPREQCRGSGGGGDCDARCAHAVVRSRSSSRSSRMWCAAGEPSQQTARC